MHSPFLICRTMYYVYTQYVPWNERWWTTAVIGSTLCVPEQSPGQSLTVENSHTASVPWAQHLHCAVPTQNNNTILHVHFDKSKTLILVYRIAQKFDRGEGNINRFDAQLVICRNFPLIFSNCIANTGSVRDYLNIFPIKLLNEANPSIFSSVKILRYTVNKDTRLSHLSFTSCWHSQLPRQFPIVSEDLSQATTQKSNHNVWL